MTQIVCHRGDRLNAPENTFAAAKSALQRGGAVIELDIRQSRDGVLYVLHDETVDRTTNGSGKISEMASTQIDQLDAGGWFDGRFAGQNVPRLQDYLLAFCDRAGFYLEIKKADCSKVAELVDRLGIEDRCFTFSFDPEMRRDIEIHAPNLTRMIHWTAAGSVQSVVEDHHAKIVEFHTHDFDPLNIAACQAAGLKVMFYTDRHDPERFQQALNLSMDYVNIDNIEDFDRLRRAHAVGQVQPSN